MTNLPTYLTDKLDGIHKITGLSEFALFGSFPIDTLLNGGTQNLIIHDVDFSLRGYTRQIMDSVESSLERSGYSFLMQRREYPIQRGQVMVVCTYATNGTETLDINYMDDPTSVGLFNIDSLYCTFPDYKLVDLYGTIDGIMSKVIRPKGDLSTEHPTLVAASMIKLAAKYHIPLVSQDNYKISEQVVVSLSREFSEFTPYTTSLISQTFKAILRVKDKAGLIRELTDIGLFGVYLPEITLARTLDNDLLTSCTSIDDLVKVFLEGMESNLTQADFIRKVQPLSKRVWESPNYILKKGALANG